MEREDDLHARVAIWCLKGPNSLISLFWHCLKKKMNLAIGYFLNVEINRTVLENIWAKQYLWKFQKRFELFYQIFINYMALIRHIFFLGFGHFWFNLWMNLAFHFFGHGNPASCLKQMDRKKEQVAIQKNGFEDVANIKKRKKLCLLIDLNEKKRMQLCTPTKSSMPFKNYVTLFCPSLIMKTMPFVTIFIFMAIVTLVTFLTVVTIMTFATLFNLLFLWRFWPSPFETLETLVFRPLTSGFVNSWIQGKNCIIWTAQIIVHVVGFDLLRVSNLGRGNGPSVLDGVHALCVAGVLQAYVHWKMFLLDARCRDVTDEQMLWSHINVDDGDDSLYSSLQVKRMFVCVCERERSACGLINISAVDKNNFLALIIILGLSYGLEYAKKYQILWLKIYLVNYKFKYRYFRS